MGKFNEYSQKATPADNDTMMIYDAAAKANKLSPFSGIWNWIVEKLTNAVISNLQTSNKSVIGALNELNSKTPSKNVNSLENYMKNAPIGVSFCDCQNADDNPFKGTMSICMTFVNDDHSWGVQYLFVYKDIRYRTMSTGAVNEWKQIAYSKTSKLALEENVTNIQALISKASSGTCILFHLSGTNYAGNDLPIGEKYKYGSGIIFYRNSNSCKIVLFPEEVKPVWKMANWAKWKDFANNIVD